jgi:uncharacterized membrane protein
VNGLRRYRGPLLAGAALTVATWAFVSFTPVFSSWLFGDARFYENWGNYITNHQVPYRDFDIEYPPGALPTFAVPVYLKLLFGHYNTWYFWFRIELLAFALLMLGGMTWALTELRASRRHAYVALCVAGATPALLGPIALFHYDYFPAMFAVFAVAALLARRGVLACTFAALGAVAKVYPIVIVPIALIELWRHGRWRSVGAGVGATLAVGLVTVGPFAVIAPHGIWWSIHREAARHLETESLGASILGAAHEIAGVHLHVVARDASHSLEGAWPNAFASASAVLTVVALIGVYLLFWRSSRSHEDVVIACAAAVTAYVLFSKVFSPQYVVWLVPLVPLVGGRRGLRASVLLVAILGVTQIFEPYRYFQYWHFDTPWLTWTVVFRNVLVIALLGVLVWPMRARKLDFSSPKRP